GLLHLRKEPLLLKDLVEEVAQPFRVLARSQKIRFQTRYRENNKVVFGDRRKILQALLNILDNAFKVTPPGGEVVLEAREGEGRVEIRISDTGPGIAPEEVSRIFERFYRRSPSGRGLGLALAKAYIEAHGGQILVSSSPGRGSLFSVYLPSPELAKGTSGH
ncbi:MAG TPA: ATP-binding protein, partial [Thermodesulfatator sp.]|nr:ATP-binding protein [Thermodesulfatator sp.]